MNILPYAPLFKIPDTSLASHPMGESLVASWEEFTKEALVKESRDPLVRIIGIALTKIQTAFEEDDDTLIRLNKLHQSKETFFLFENREVIVTLLGRNGIEATCIEAFGQNQLMSIELIVLETFSLFAYKPELYRENRFFYEPTKVNIMEINAQSGLPSINAKSTKVLCDMRSSLIEDGNNPAFLLLIEQALDAILYCSGDRNAFHLIVQSAETFSEHPFGYHFIELVNWYRRQSLRMRVFFE